VAVRVDPAPGRRESGAANAAYFDALVREVSGVPGVQALGLTDIGFDALAPTLRSGLTGPRHTTSILSSVSALKRWSELQIWPNGVASDREQAARYIPDNGHLRLAVADCAILQGFSESWQISGPVYVAIGQIGNSVAPPVAYHLARSISEALFSTF